MITQERKVTLELISENETCMTSPINKNSNTEKYAECETGLVSEMVTTILDNELPMLKNNSLLHDLVLYTVLEKMNTVQNVKNVLSYIKDNRVKEVRDVYFRNGEVRIKCSI